MKNVLGSGDHGWTRMNADARLGRSVVPFDLRSVFICVHPWFSPVHRSRPIKRLLLLAVLLLPVLVHAQRTRVTGRVFDQATGDPLPYANVVFPGSTVGTTTDTVGFFRLNDDQHRDSLRVSMTGYRARTIALKGAVDQGLVIGLDPMHVELHVFEVRPGENPAFAVLRQVIARKPFNAPERLDAYHYTSYDRVRFDLNHFTDRIKKNFLLKPFDYLWDGIDTTADGVRYLPILLNEREEEHDYRRDPRSEKRVVMGTKAYKFFRAPRIMEFVEDMAIEPDINEEQVTILDRSFPSPINSHFQQYYRYLLDDTLRACDGYICHRITFRPKHIGDAAFRGEMLIDTTSKAVVRVDLAFSIEANINFVRNYWIRQDRAPVAEGPWFVRSSQVIGDFTVIENSADMTGFFGRRTSTVSDITIGQTREEAFYKQVDPVIVQDSAALRNDAWWRTVRPDTFTVEERDLVTRVDRMAHDPRWQRREGLLHLIGEGWQPLGPIDLGNVYTFFSTNPVEDQRVKLGLRTNDHFSRTWRFAGHLAYGFGDARWKGGLSGAVQLNGPRRQRTLIGAEYLDDMLQPGRSASLLPLDHVLTSFVRLSGPDPRWYLRATSAYVERQWPAGLAVRCGSVDQRISAPDVGFFRVLEGDTTGGATVTLSGVRLGARFAFGVKDLDADYTTILRGLFVPRVPIVSLEILLSGGGLGTNAVPMQRYRLKVEDRLRTPPFGYLDIYAEGGLIDGDVPYPLLHFPNSDPLLFNDVRSFNLMNFLEFAADRWATLQLEQHFEGHFLDRIPLLRWAKLREFVLAKAFLGSLSAANRNGAFPLPDGLSDARDPYVEVGFGIENILKVARVDFLWRLTDRDHAGALPFIVKPSFYFRF
ncbi:MAG: carboxypeptidase-like regulatory domain-containing protein [Flavobacteriales bacterium]|nr:carboxypeptidase-like regulatory domain-containing protein [Flavobacteriales bacterium]